MATSTKAPLLVAIESFAVETGRHANGEPIMVIVQAGLTKYPADHAIVKGREHLFAPVEANDR